MKYPGPLILTIAICSVSPSIAQDSTSLKLNPDSLAVPPRHIRLSPNGPLYIVDKVEISLAELNRIKAENIESITVLKDSASTAAYGEKGKLGVILIEMKQPKKKDP